MMSNLAIALLILSVYIYSSEALECGISQRIDRNFKKTLSSCLGGNMTMQEIFDFSSLDFEIATMKIDVSNTSKPVPSQNRTENSTSIRVKRAETENSTSTTPTPDQSEFTTDIEQSTTEMTQTEAPITRTCIVKCVLSNFGLTDAAGFPHQEKIVNGLLKFGEGRELHDFFQDVIDECFQRANKEFPQNSCDFSLELVKCMSDFAKFNCADWPAGDISIFNNY